MKTTNVGLIKELSSRYGHLQGDISAFKKVSGIDSEYGEIACEILGNVLNKVIWLYKSKEEDKTFKVSVGDTFDIAKIVELGYERVERVWNEGEISVLGDVVLLWPFSMNRLIRLSLFGKEIENISLIDIDSRKKVKDVKSREILPPDSDLIVGNEDLESSINIRIVNDLEEDSDVVSLGIRRIPGTETFTNKVALMEIIKNYKGRGYDIWYLTSNFDRYEESVEEEVRKNIDRVFFAKDTFEKNIRKGFVSSEAKAVVLTDLEVLGQLDLSLYEKKNMKMDPGSVEILKKITPGDYIVHEDHGIGRFMGVVQRKHGPYIDISYAGKDRLYVPLTASEKLMKYIGAGRKKPLLTGLNSGVWRRISQKAKKSVEDIAKELLQLYALRESSQAELILENESSVEELYTFVKRFEFEDTDDQLLATNHIVEDFQNTKPMDRLLVGDVGYGKTEIAARAMFSVMGAGCQVAFLAPTTILVEQHVSVLRERFKEYPFHIEALSRFTNKDDRERIVSGLKKGTVDLVVGTHALLNKEIEFKDLGLLVVDEEQKFGVKQKESIKAKRVDTNVLSLTATPIPRTLNMALMGIRDISVLATPPQGRVEISNTFGVFDWEKVKEAISKELERKGQVYFLHNRVGTIQEVYMKLATMFPDVNVAVAHGQMSTDKLSGTMRSFSKGDIDILVCTTIIENGLDIPNVNTLIIEDATMLGLSQLYQIRGRVGRSSRQAYAYFFFKDLKGDAVLRLEALKESKELGSGFLLSNKDLEIRGAGDILGKNQSGSINSVGYGLYSQMLEKAVGELKEMGK